MILGKCDKCSAAVVKHFSSFGVYYDCDCSSTTQIDMDYDQDISVGSSSIWWDSMRGILIDEY